MDKIKSFLHIKRRQSKHRLVRERIKDYKDVLILPSDGETKEQSSRCMDCSTAFCHWGCPLENYIPEWNDFVFRGRWKEAFELLNAVNNLAEITGRICPAVCEYACVLGLDDNPVTICSNELAIIEHAFKEGFVRPNTPQKRSGKKAAIIGSGPAGLSAASELNKMGHKTVVFERDSKIGGILRYGIPDFKLEKWIIDRRLDIMREEGIEFAVNSEVGRNYPFKKIRDEFDAVCLAGGCRVPRDLKIEGRDLKGIYFAMDYLTQANKLVSKEKNSLEEDRDAKGKKVVVIGGGDTGADCVGSANRQGAESVTQIEVLPKPPEVRSQEYPWPYYPKLLKTSTSHEEGCWRQWSVTAKEFLGDGSGRVKKILCAKTECSKDERTGKAIMKETLGANFEIEADMVILAMGFLHPRYQGLLEELKVELDERGYVKTDKNFMTSQKGIFAAGDMRKGQSLVVWAVSEGKNCAQRINRYLNSNFIS